MRFILKLFATLAVTAQTFASPSNSQMESSFKRSDLSTARTCGEETSYNNTRFQNPSYPNDDTGPISNCELTINQVNDNICQLRLDFIDFDLAQPNTDGACEDDFMTITGGSFAMPTLCGLNTGQHIYVPVDKNFGSAKINIDTSNQDTVGRSWDIIVTQIECDSLYKAPDDCLQYFTDSSGTVKSFNYDATVTDFTTAGTHQLQNQNYAVCIERKSGYCSITWTPGNGATSFSVTGDPTVPIQLALVGETDCPTDYVIIPNGAITDSNTDPPIQATSADRFCGTRFPDQVRSESKPFVLQYVTNSIEADADNPAQADADNQGFQLQYRQNVC